MRPQNAFRLIATNPNSLIKRYGGLNRLIKEHSPHIISIQEHLQPMDKINDKIKLLNPLSKYKAYGTSTILRGGHANANFCRGTCIIVSNTFESSLITTNKSATAIIAKPPTIQHSNNCYLCIRAPRWFRTSQERYSVHHQSNPTEPNHQFISNYHAWRFQFTTTWCQSNNYTYSGTPQHISMAPTHFWRTNHVHIWSHYYLTR